MTLYKNHMPSALSSMYALLFMFIFSLIAAVQAADTGSVDTSVASEGQIGITDTLQGELPLKVVPGIYFIAADVEVAAGETVYMDSGVVFLFPEFTGILINGALIAKGTESNPVVFTSINDKNYSEITSLPAAPYDWNGVTISSQSVGSHLAYTKVIYSLFGLNALTEHFSLTECVFDKNGKSNLIVTGTRYEIDGTPLSLNNQLHTPAQPATPDTIIQQEEDPRQKQKRARIRRAIFAGVSASVAVASAYMYTESNKEFKQINNVTPELKKDASSAEQWEEASRRKNSWLGATFTAIGLTTFYAAGFLFTLF